VGQAEFGTKTEVKNINSFRAIEKALIAEEIRHAEVLNESGKIVQETRFFDDVTETTTGMRSKEFAHDYRYFPEPDLVPVAPSKEWVEEIKGTIGELPNDRTRRFISELQLSAETAAILVNDKPLAEYFETAVKAHPKPVALANWLTGEIMAYLKEQKKAIGELPMKPEQLAELQKAIDDGTISGKIAKTVLAEVIKSGKAVKEVIAASGLTQISNEGELVAVIQEIIKNNPGQVAQFKGGKETVIMFFVGQVMKATKGRANPELVNKLLKEQLAL
jgi:aspartyl-tRNA(Asn)/glutamyl-tRNA(Gln) amidotransferase subunit B